MDHVNNLERAIPKLAPLSYLLDPEKRLEKYDLAAAGGAGL